MILALVLCMGILFTACSGKTPNTPSESDSSQIGNPNHPNTPNTGDDVPDTQYIVNFDSQGGSVVESQTVVSGNLLTVPANPTKEGYDFLGWFKVAAENAERWNFETDTVTAEITIYAHWQAQASETAGLTFSQNGNGYTVTGYTGDNAVVIIPAAYNGQPVTMIGESAFAYSRHNEPITSITDPSQTQNFHSENTLEQPSDFQTSTEVKPIYGSVTEGSDSYRGFVLDNVYHSESNGDIHYNLYVPESYDGSRPYALFVSLPGYEGLYFQGVGTNIRAEQFVMYMF